MNIDMNFFELWSAIIALTTAFQLTQLLAFAAIGIPSVFLFKLNIRLVHCFADLFGGLAGSILLANIIVATIGGRDTGFPEFLIISLGSLISFNNIYNSFGVKCLQAIKNEDIDEMAWCAKTLNFYLVTGASATALFICGIFVPSIVLEPALGDITVSILSKFHLGYQNRLFRYVVILIACVSTIHIITREIPNTFKGIGLIFSSGRRKALISSLNGDI